MEESLNMGIPSETKIERIPIRKYWKLIDILDIVNASDESFKKLYIPEENKNHILEDVQANILKGTKHKYTLFCFLTFYDDYQKKDIVSWLEDIPLTSAKDQIRGVKGDVVSISLSYEGYVFLFNERKIKREIEINDDDLIAFVDGLSKRCPNAFGKNKRTHLEKNYQNPCHALILIATDDDRLGKWNKLDDENKKHRKLMKFFKKKTSSNENLKSFRRKFGKVFFEIGLRNPEGSDESMREWFGFRDGISNPRFFPSPELIRLWDEEQFKPDPVSKLNVALRPNTLSSRPYACGSFVVFLKLEQDKEAFDEKVDKIFNDELVNDSKERVAAYMVGRYEDGTPLHDKFKYKSGISNGNLNNFDFDNDANGEVCPFHAHIRKANPRDGSQKRIVRRGKIYGNKKSKEKGVLFLSYQSSLRNFEEIVNNGLYGYNSKIRNTGQDALFAEKNGKYVKGNEYRTEKGIWVDVNTNKDFIRFKGGQYFFASSISFIQDGLRNFI